jgi:hypothetical protein
MVKKHLQQTVCCVLLQTLGRTACCVVAPGPWARIHIPLFLLLGEGEEVVFLEVARKAEGAKETLAGVPVGGGAEGSMEAGLAGGVVKGTEAHR